MRLLMVTVVMGALALAPSAHAADDPGLQARYAGCIRSYQARHYDAARACLQAFVAAVPTSANAHFVLGESAAALGDLAVARTAFAQAVALAPDDDVARACLIDALLQLGELDGAIAQARLGDARRPRWLGFKVLLIQAYQRKNDVVALGEVRRQLFELRNRDGVTDGLTDRDGYLRETFRVGDASVNGIEYFTADQPAGPKYRLLFTGHDGRVVSYQLESDPDIDALEEKQGKRAKGAPPTYVLDAHLGGSDRLVRAFAGDPGYVTMRDAAVAHYRTLR